MGMAVAVLALAGCTDDEGGTPAPTDSRPSTIAELAEDPSAAAAVAEGIEGLRDGNSGTFTTHLEYADLTIDYYGSYRVDPAQQRVSVTAELAEGPAVTEAVGDGGSFYVRLPPEGPVSSKCWVIGDAAQVTELTGVETNADFNQVPGAIALAATAEGIAPADAGDPHDDVLGSVDLATAAALISPRLPGLLGIVVGSDRVLARFSLDDGVLAAISVDGPAILASLAESGTDVDPAELEKVFGAATPIAVTLSDSGAEVVIEPPSPSAVIDLALPDAQERVAACEADDGTGEPSGDQPSPRAEMRRAVLQLVEDNTGTLPVRSR